MKSLFTLLVFIAILTGCTKVTVTGHQTKGSPTTSAYITTIEGCDVYRIDGDAISASYLYLSKCKDGANSSVTARYSRGKAGMATAGNMTGPSDTIDDSSEQQKQSEADAAQRIINQRKAEIMQKLSDEERALLGLK